jgi:nitrogen regulatory protein PII-like uncharacterized protein
MINISQSFLKEFAKYKSGETCGLQVKAKYIDGIKFPSSVAMELGNFFEYMATGSLPRDGHVPMADIVYKGTAKESVSEKYKKALESAKKFKEIVSNFGIEIIETGKVVTHNGMTGIFDTKYSGMINDRWSEFGWNTDSLPEKHNLMIQAVHYKLLLSMEMGLEVDDVDFFFFIFSQTEVNDIKIIKVEIEESTIQSHLATVEWVKSELKKPIEKIFKANPELLRCSECILAADCQYKTTMPSIEYVLY